MMPEKQLQFLASLRIEPIILTLLQVSFVLNLHIDAVSHLVRIGLLRPLGNPPAGAQKYFATGYIRSLAHDDKWQNKAAKAIRAYNSLRNGAGAERQLGESKVKNNSDLAAIRARSSNANTRGELHV